MDKIPFSRGTPMRCVARTQSIEEAQRVAESFEMQGYTTQIIEKKQGTLKLYEVWVGKEEGLEIKEKDQLGPRFMAKE